MNQSRSSNQSIKMKWKCSIMYSQIWIICNKILGNRSKSDDILIIMLSNNGLFALPSNRFFFCFRSHCCVFLRKRKLVIKTREKKMHLHHVSGFARFIALNLKLFTWLYYMQFCFLFFFSQSGVLFFFQLILFSFVRRTHYQVFLC